ncbi:fungal-specific transcription factor domain-containing protein [Penicillium daleae]|uniref:Fungal-specific transcription factor domain-containing protein n=1 Tax=Penicillium daleae TaxID=63821 RepID=A0AAD6CFK1_9EURO|nr:fungal-specific transcription factor domain-containing protein [Penicillium daleae]KAJ5464357.1 fungal-specific transcription factor domain-containing protein [Penicillium daleae]
MKPGPKIGSSQKQRKRRRQNETSQSRQINSHSRPPPGPFSGPRNGDFDPLDDGLEKEELLPAVRADLTETTTGMEMRGSSQQRTSQLNTLDLAFILHPSHEVTTPDQAQRQSPSFQDGQHTGLCRQACTELGVSQAAMNEM